MHFHSYKYYINYCLKWRTRLPCSAQPKKYLAIMLSPSPSINKYRYKSIGLKISSTYSRSSTMLKTRRPRKLLKKKYSAFKRKSWNRPNLQLDFLGNGLANKLINLHFHWDRYGANSLSLIASPNTNS